MRGSRVSKDGKPTIREWVEGEYSSRLGDKYGTKPFRASLINVKTRNIFPSYVLTIEPANAAVDAIAG